MIKEGDDIIITEVDEKSTKYLSVGEILQVLHVENGLPMVKLKDGTKLTLNLSKYVNYKSFIFDDALKDIINE